MQDSTFRTVHIPELSLPKPPHCAPPPTLDMRGQLIMSCVLPCIIPWTGVASSPNGQAVRSGLALQYVYVPEFPRLQPSLVRPVLLSGSGQSTNLSLASPLSLEHIAGVSLTVQFECVSDQQDRLIP